ncbi:MAG: hypothetical protein C0506_14110 [Anaerolinea sp.]|nr:hypothetical protein [Anaerolinea sp.]
MVESAPRDTAAESGGSLPAASITGELAVSYSTLRELTEAAAEIAVVRVELTENRPYKDVPFTVATVSVLRSLKGSSMPGSTLTVVEMGGVFAGRSKLEPGARGTPVEVGVEGVPVMKAQEEYLLFLGGPTHVGPVLEGARPVLGVFQGKMRIDTAGVLRFPGASESLAGIEFAVPRALIGRPLQAVEAEIRADLRR